MSFEEFKKIPRLFRDCTITEKIDGTNGQILIKPVLRENDARAEGDVFITSFNGDGRPILNGGLVDPPLDIVDMGDGFLFAVWAGSRNRWVYTGKSTDNNGFARWVLDRAASLVEILGPGRHYGEFWGSGIQRRYGLTGDDKRFSLFNPKWDAILAGRVLGGLPIPDGLGVVPLLYEGEFDTDQVDFVISDLARDGSAAEPGFMDPEGVVIYHEAAKQYFKVTIKDDEKPKGSTE